MGLLPYVLGELAIIRRAWPKYDEYPGLDEIARVMPCGAILLD